VFLMPNVLIRHWIRRDVVHHCQCAGGRAVVPVHVFEPSRTREA
jgi:hypothetical protein